MNKRFARTLWFALASTPCAAVAQTTPDIPSKIAALERQVQQDLQERKPQLAVSLLRQVVALDPNNLNAHANLGVLLFFQGDDSEAISQLRAALELQPDLAKIEALLGVAEKRTGDTAKAQKNLEHAFPNVEEKAIRLQAGLVLIELDVASGQLGKAADVAEILEDVAPEEPKIILAAYQISLQMTDRSLLSMAVLAPESAEMHMMIANQFGRQGDGANAIAQYRAVIRLNPRLPGVHFELAEQLRAASDPSLKSLAEAEYQAALAINESDQKAWRGLGETLADKGDYVGASKDLSKAIALNPEDADAKTDLAMAIIPLKEIDQAVALLESAVKEDPTNIVAHFRLGTLYRQAGKTADAEREMESFRRYKAMKDKLGATFKQMQTRSTPN